ncbi:MAG: hypothetical protein OES29_13180, partial [Desulfuromonadales bacterium]|nr:hypothetical protein [Desulfuromonadales bacterium]
MRDVFVGGSSIERRKAGRFGGRIRPGITRKAERIEMKSILTTSIFLMTMLAFTSTQAWDPKGHEEDIAKGQEAID